VKLLREHLQQIQAVQRGERGADFGFRGFRPRESNISSTVRRTENYSAERCHLRAQRMLVTAPKS